MGFLVDPSPRRISAGWSTGAYGRMVSQSVPRATSHPLTASSVPAEKYKDFPWEHSKPPQMEVGKSCVIYDSYIYQRGVLAAEA